MRGIHTVRETASDPAARCQPGSADIWAPKGQSQKWLVSGGCVRSRRLSQDRDQGIVLRESWGRNGSVFGRSGTETIRKFTSSGLGTCGRGYTANEIEV